MREGCQINVRTLVLQGVPAGIEGLQPEKALDWLRNGGSFVAGLQVHLDGYGPANPGMNLRRFKVKGERRPICSRDRGWWKHGIGRSGGATREEEHGEQRARKGSRP